ncbi:MAG: DnaD domain protein [Clostridia bacterium]|nr:DnaD domain protein [Clostridia bacterium]
MAFCSFDDSAALFDATPVENMFITEYMLRAPGDFVKVYLYGLMLCYHQAERMSMAAMAKDLDMAEEDVERAFKYWAREGLVRQTGDNPVSYAYFNLKQMTLTRAENPGEILYNRNFTEEIRRILDGQTLGENDYQRIFDWVDVLELPEEVVLMLLQTERQRSRSGRVAISIADRVAREWAQSGVRTVEDVEKIVILGRERETQLRKLLSRLGQRRAPSDDEKAMYKKWIDEWGFTPEAVQEACRETTKGTPTMAYLDGILLRQHQLGRHEAQALASGIVRERTARDFAREVLAGLGRTGVTPTQEDMAAIDAWRQAGNSEELILLAVAAAHKRTNGGNFDDVDQWLARWQKQGLRTPEAVRAESARVRALNAQLREIYEAAGLEKRPNGADRDLLCRWAGEMGMSAEMILLAAQYARGGGAPMLFIGKILADWQRAGISTEETARAEHEAHMRGGAQTAAEPKVAARGQDVLMRHNYTADDYRSMVVDLDEEES